MGPRTIVSEVLDLSPRIAQASAMYGGLGVVALFVSALLAWVTLGYGEPGQTANGGLVAQVGRYSIGLELWGTPGVFGCEEDC